MKAMVLLSGGVDSTTLLAMAVEEYGRENVMALSMSYGQKHQRELWSAEQIAGHYGVEKRDLNLAEIFCHSNSSLLAHSEESIPRGSYGEQKGSAADGLVSTYVPFRNGLFLAAAASVALGSGCGVLCYGAHHDDVAVAAYPDCSAAFVEAMDRAIFEGSGGQLRVMAPFVEWDKAQIVKKGLELGVPYELTWSCYEGGETPCGHCGTCKDRQKAFELNGVKDPLLIGG
ncbi:MAG: hypothetical protein H6Q61_172 [Firmicutes bacterium]|nr:hypothetical protein [Bacillota bacterium]